MRSRCPALVAALTVLLKGTWARQKIGYGYDVGLGGTGASPTFERVLLF